MNRKTTATNLCALLALAIVATLCTMQFAHATGKPEPTPAPQQQSQGQQQAIDLSLMNAPGGIRQGDSYALAATASAAPLPPGLCPKGDSEAFSIVWGLVSWSRSSTRSEVECLDKVLANQLAQVTQRPADVRYVSISPEPKQPEAIAQKACEAAKPAARPDPRKAKVAKKAGVCT